MMADQPTVLLVEDNDDHAEFVLRTLEDHQVPTRVVRVADGEAAMDYLLHRGAFSDPRESPRPQLMLLDLHMPKLDGLGVLRQVKGSSELRNIPVVVLTSSDNDSDIQTAQALHANAYVSKPVDFERFVDLVNQLGLFWLVWNRAPAPPAGQAG